MGSAMVPLDRALLSFYSCLYHFAICNGLAQFAMQIFLTGLPTPIQWGRGPYVM